MNGCLASVLFLATGLLSPGLAAGADMMTNAAPAEMAPGMTPAAMQAAAAPKQGTPVNPAAVPEDYFQRYGKILSPGTDPNHPLKLSMPFPDVGQVKIPSAEELKMRETLERLSTLSDADIRRDLQSWPAWDKMSLADEGAMLMRIQMFKDRRAKMAQDRAHALGLLTLKPDQMERFQTEYWDKRMQMDEELARQFGPIYKAREQKLNEDLFREFSTPGMPVPPPAPPKPPATATTAGTPMVPH